MNQLPSYNETRPGFGWEDFDQSLDAPALLPRGSTVWDLGRRPTTYNYLDRDVMPFIADIKAKMAEAYAELRRNKAGGA